MQGHRLRGRVGAWDVAGPTVCLRRAPCQACPPIAARICSARVSPRTHRRFHTACKTTCTPAHTWVRGLLWSRCEPQGEKAAGRQSWTGISRHRDSTSRRQSSTLPQQSSSATEARFCIARHTFWVAFRSFPDSITDFHPSPSSVLSELSALELIASPGSPDPFFTKKQLVRVFIRPEWYQFATNPLLRKGRNTACRSAGRLCRISVAAIPPSLLWSAMPQRTHPGAPPASLFPRAPRSAPSIPLCDAIPLAGPTTRAASETKLRKQPQRAIGHAPEQGTHVRVPISTSGWESGTRV